MRVLLTGGAGYLGSWVAPLLMERGHTIRLFDRFCFGDDAVRALMGSPQCEIVRGDIRRLQETPALLDGVDAIAHLASLSNDPSCNLDPEMTIDVNLDSTRELASQALLHGVHRFVLASSCAVFGHGLFEVLDEQSPANPVSAFASSKLDAERVIMGMKSDSFEPVAARAATLFGWSPRMRFDLVLNQMVASAARRGVIEVFGGGGQWRPFVHVRDAARAIVLMLEAPADDVSGEVFNVGADVLNTRIGDLAHRIARHFPGVQVRVVEEDDDPRSYRVRFGKIRSRLGFTHEYSIDEGIQEVRNWLQSESDDPFGEAYCNIKRMKTLLATPVNEGGEPVAPRFIPLAQPAIGPDEEEAVLQAIQSGWLTSGPQILAFEKALGELVESPYVMSACSCTAAIHLCLAEAGIKPGDEVITSPLTWASIGSIILHMGAKPVFADIVPGTLNMDPAALDRVITARTRMIIPVHLAGQPCALDEIYAVARKHGIPVVEDAAHALGASYHGVPIGRYGERTCFSFYAIKNITTMEGGAIALKDPDAAARLRMLSANGMAVNAWQRYGRSAAPSPPEVQEPGYKYQMSNVGAALGLAQLRRFGQFQETRYVLAMQYRALLADVEEVRALDQIPDIEHAWHLFIVRINRAKVSKTRDELAQALRRENIGTGCHFYGLHLHRYYREVLGMQPEDLPEATAASQEIISLPLFPMMTERNVGDVVVALKKVLAR